MTLQPNTTFTEQQRAFFLAYANGALWALGNGLGSTALVVYLVRQLGAAGLGIGAILAAPHIAGVLRLGAPALIGRVAQRRGFCMSCYGASALLLAIISQLAEPGRLTSPEFALPLVVALWCVYHLLEYAATVILWSWLGDLAPADIRGQFIGIRERWMLLARIVGMLLAGGFSWAWSAFTGPDAAWIGYAVPACFAAALMMAAIVPLARMPDPREATAKPPNVINNLVAPLPDARMRWLLAFGVWFSLANGLTQSAQYLFPIIAFGLPLLARNVYVSGMRLGQASLASAVGKYLDRFGHRKLLILSQLVVEIGPLFFLLAKMSPDDFSNPAYLWPFPFWVLAGAWIAWIAYVGLNVGLPSLMLKLAGPQEKAAYVAWYFAVTGIVYGLSTIAGGALYDWCEKTQPIWRVSARQIAHHHLFFVGGFVLRILSVLWLIPLREDT